MDLINKRRTISYLINIHKIFSVYRIETYNQSTKPIVEHYHKLDKVRNISADGSPEQVCTLELFCLFIVYAANSD